MAVAKPIAPEHVYLILWKAFYAVEDHDRRSIRSLGFKSDSDFALLEVLFAKGPLPVNDVGRRVLLTSGSITTAVDRAEKRGLVRRLPDPRDKRVVRVELTDKGRATIEGALKIHFRNLAHALSGLTPTEQETLAALLRKVGRHAAALTERIVR
jgi:MarR family 2-MHQ and catechol resistance regulon transcriptional repressor